ncbi:VOC family protein [Rhodoligotrophos defluvii]|uniref:VOC family protein n=1 Tax=Rhodoligotrophos defluvii TaxID=2561934 RepID=UPI001EF10B8A|nr:VOC family protein [Rhodoligotrophos defluvii]
MDVRSETDEDGVAQGHQGKSLIMYTTLGVRDVRRAIPFYDAVLGVLGHRRRSTSDEWVAWGPDYDHGVSFCICPPFDGNPPSVGNGTMIALRAQSDKEVDAFYEAALRHGGSSEGPPGTREAYDPNFYVCYVRDLDGNKLACAFPHYGE